MKYAILIMTVVMGLMVINAFAKAELVSPKLVLTVIQK